MSSDLKINILVIEERSERAESLCLKLKAERFSGPQYLQINELPHTQINGISPDLLIISQDTVNQASVALVKALMDLSSCPALVFSRHNGEAEIIQQLVEIGASCYQQIDVCEIPLRPLIENSCDHFSNLNRLTSELKATKTQLADRKQIERAKGLLMKKHECDEEQAYIAMRKLAMNRAQRMGDVARELIQALAS